MEILACLSSLASFEVANQPDLLLHLAIPCSEEVVQLVLRQTLEQLLLACLSFLANFELAHQRDPLVVHSASCYAVAPQPVRTSEQLPLACCSFLANFLAT